MENCIFFLMGEDILIRWYSMGNDSLLSLLKGRYYCDDIQWEMTAFWRKDIIAMIFDGKWQLFEGKILLRWYSMGNDSFLKGRYYCDDIRWEMTAFWREDIILAQYFEILKFHLQVKFITKTLWNYKNMRFL